MIYTAPMNARLRIAALAVSALSIQGCFTFGSLAPQPSSASQSVVPYAARVVLKEFHFGSGWRWDKAALQSDLIVYARRRGAFLQVVEGPAELVLEIEANASHSRAPLAENLTVSLRSSLRAGERAPVAAGRLGGYSGSGSATATLTGDSVSGAGRKALTQALDQLFDDLERDRDALAAKLGAAPAAATARRPEARPDSGLSAPRFAAADRAFGEDDAAVVIGVEKYQDIPPADFAAADARLVKEYLLALGMSERNIELLVDERATGTAMRKILQSWLPNRVKPGSRVFVYYSGHGAPEPAGGKSYLVPHDGDPNYLTATGYPLEELYAGLGRLPGAEVAVVLDSCFSGAGGRSVLAKGARPLVASAPAPSLPSKVAVLAATEGAQISTVSRERGHGLLTYHFLKALRDGGTDLASIHAAIRPRVEDEAKRENVTQTPSLLSDPRSPAVRFRLRR
jgi:hypothetical protein